MWCIINKINNENDALLYDTQQNELIPSYYLNLINNRILSQNNRLKYSPQFHIKSSISPKIIKNDPSLIKYNSKSNINHVLNKDDNTIIN